MPRRTFAEIDAAARADERIGVIDHAARHHERIEAAVLRGTMTRDAGDHLKRIMTAFAGEVAAGLHIGGTDSRATRHAVRARVKARDQLANKEAGQ